MRYKRILVICLLLVLSAGWLAQADAHKGDNLPTTPFDHTHALFADVLKQYVHEKDSSTAVDYAGLKKNDAALKSYLSTVTSVSSAAYADFSEDEKLAFLINAYNAFTLELIITNYPIQSIKDLGSILRSPWKKKFFTILGKESNLDGIEHGRIRKEFAEPRIHFAVNCASIGCPALRAEPFLAESLEEQLEDATRLFLKDKSRNRFEVESSQLLLSGIFNWYGEDFIESKGSVEAFVAPYLATANAPAEVIASAKKTSFLDYDWGLNELS